jgi:hypothetical protein
MSNSRYYQLQQHRQVPRQSQQQTQISDVITGKIFTSGGFLLYSSSDGKVCLVFATVSTSKDLGLKPGSDIALLVPDQTMCVLLGQANIAKTEIQFQVALPALQHDLPPTSSGQYLVIYRK